MPKIKKKGTSGQAKNFITRTQAVRKLQISLPDFRRLCIFKGIYPREPRNKKKASKSSTQSTTFYYTKDIQYLLHEPLINKFREHKALAKKIARSLGRGEVGDAARLEKFGTPKISLDHIIKERYPTFVDALRDLDDALSMLFLFANLPSTSTVPPKTIGLCQRLCLEFEHYLITTNSLRKSFLSIKGIYYQATIQGQDILWLVPYKFVQRVTGDVDFRIMGTFVEFYTTLLGFVNFRLYTSIGLVYPPKFSARSDERGGELGAFTLEGRGVQASNQLAIQDTPASNQVNGASEPNGDIQAQVDAITKLPGEGADVEPDQPEAPAEESNDAIDTFETTGEGADVLPQPHISGSEASSLFAPFTFFLSRETPRQPLEFILRAFGCKRVGWDAVLGNGAFTHNESDSAITHQIVDRPPLPQISLPEVPEASETTTTAVSSQTLRPGSRVPGRIYLQPQWVWDCINEGKLLRPDLYAPGATLPPHLSPWVKPTKGAYDPSAPLAEQEREGEAAEAEEAEAEEAAKGNGVDTSMTGTERVAADASALLEDGSTSDYNGMDVAGSGDEDKSEKADSEDNFGGFSSSSSASISSEDEAELTRTQHQKELEAEAAGLTFAEASAGAGPIKGILKNGNEIRKKAARKRREEEEELERQKMMMSRKKRKVLDKMLYSNRKKEEEAERLRGKRRRIERGVA
ncbi:MAG: ribosome biogenesis Pescadillo [Lasallia pustulata]|uniref:Pescadillo homolog n=1 Tax=Lasallia pustulata TaxID=136370 RepID=A0A5M8PLX3_9LECA|nr:MAG: ribosome biogenesis Pescadillo [Lasallia pustulata]